MKSTHREERVYGAVKAGWFEIRPDGSIWRIAQRRANRWNTNTTVTKLEKPHRVDQVGIGYRQVKIMVGRVQNCCLAHRLVWLHFFGSIPEGITINHKNGDKTDNRPENLELATQSEQMKHAYRTGLKDEHGEKNPAAKLNNLEVEAIRLAYAAGRVTQAKLATEYRVDHRTISKIVRGERRQKQKGPTADYTSNRIRGMKQRNSKGQFHS